jgi:hypothetical protein
MDGLDRRDDPLDALNCLAQGRVFKPPAERVDRFHGVI